MKFIRLYFPMLCFIASIIFGCTEPFELKTETFEDILVVEATITDEFKRQEIKLSRTFPLDSNKIVLERNAKVIVEDSNQNKFNFTEESNGVYVSDIPFKAVEGFTYKLEITDLDNRQFNSREELLAPKAQVNNLFAELETIEGQLGVQVYINSNQDVGSAKFFRYEYDETYKIIVPFYSQFDAIVDGNSSNYVINLVPKTSDVKTCYSTNLSSRIIVTNTSNLSENTISKFPIRFIPANNPILRERYSILVRQYVQSAEANNFYKILKDLSSDESLLVDNQPGFIQGNVFSQQNLNEKVIGFFDVSPVTSKRIYFNYMDFEVETPPYIFECEFLELDYNVTGPLVNEKLVLYGALTSSNEYKYVANNGSVYTIVNPECGDCTTFSSNIKPEFWID